MVKLSEACTNSEFTSFSEVMRNHTGVEDQPPFVPLIPPKCKNQGESPQKVAGFEGRPG